MTSIIYNCRPNPYFLTYSIGHTAIVLTSAPCFNMFSQHWRMLSHISPLERLFVLKLLSRTQQAMKVIKFVGFSLKPLRCGDPALPPLKAIHTVGHFSADSAHAHAVAPRVLHFSAFIVKINAFGHYSICPLVFQLPICRALHVGPIGP